MPDLTRTEFKPDDFLTPEELCQLLKIDPAKYRPDLDYLRPFKRVTLGRGKSFYVRSQVMEVLAHAVTQAGIQPKRRL